MINRKIVRPANLDLDSPGRRDYYVALEHDSMWGDHLIPLTVFVGAEAKPDQGLVAFGSTHGNEIEGPVALHHLMNDIDLNNVTGRIILIPILNAPAFRSNTRSTVTEDNVNLNRAFVDGAGRTPALGGITHRIADFVREYIWPRVHIVIDLHSGGTGSRFLLCSSFHPLDNLEQSKRIEETARWFGTPLVMVYQNQTPGLLPSEAERLGKITVGTELGWGKSVNIDGVAYGRQGVMAAAIHHGMLHGKIDPIGYHRDGRQRRVAIVERDCYVPAPFDGHFEPLQRLGDSVRAGDKVGYLHDFDRIDLEPYPIHAAVDGIVMVQAWEAKVNQGQHIVVVGIEEDWEGQ
jgi:N-alpha-acetyl-L-2,4-diaminobutyrate deacetylase